MPQQPPTKGLRPTRSPGFDRVAPLYPRLEHLVHGQRLERGRQAFLPELENCRNLLLLGEGNGRFLRALLAQNPTCAVTVVEVSPRMIAHARQRLSAADAGRVSWIEASALEVELPAESFDAVVTHYLFDLFNPDGQAQMLANGLRALRAGGLWQDTEFRADGPTRFARLKNRLLLAASYRFLGALCDFPARQLADHRPLMHAAGLELLEERPLGHLLTARLWQRTEA
ncbi:class I SAM-dependent methyltransferase [Ruficoccus sp. ZRK36]|uniref:class I SAM-dependent methyltransferase n=1 Tax=Ruficoccus sp. ZRK36 TaxID=2866311 RepID=UPI001C733696|nr:class I SAM-dependent methyltransferase [Ruficoccus sp. ZRK36]QYY35705.1 class I SAM-dependent methyltransferase [Ruficoccus sp. ZRK36]